MKMSWWLIILVVGGLLAAVVFRRNIPYIEDLLVKVGLNDFILNVENAFVELVQGNPSVIISLITGSIGAATLFAKKLGDNKQVAQDTLNQVSTQFNTQIGAAQHQIMSLQDTVSTVSSEKEQLTATLSQYSGEINVLHNQLYTVQQELKDKQNLLTEAVTQRDEYRIAATQLQKQTFR